MIDSWKLDKNGNVIETPWSDLMKKVRKLEESGKYKPVTIPHPQIDHYAFCKSCFHYEACSGVDSEDHMYDMTEADCEDYISVMSPEKFTEAMKELDHECDHGDTEVAHVQMDDLMCKVLKALGYGEGVEIFTNAHKWYA